MFPRIRAARGLPAVVPALLVAMAFALAACGGSAATFNPSGPCSADGRAAGAYPDLEARLPVKLNGAAPGTVDSGRHCSENALGSLIAHDAAGVQFAGATWDLGGGTGVSSVVFRLPDRDLPAAWIAEFYEIGARTAKRTENIETSQPSVGGAGQVYRLDSLNGLSFQTVIAWQDGSLVRVVLVATAVGPDASRVEHDDLVSGAVGATVAGAAGAG